MHIDSPLKSLSTTLVSLSLYKPNIQDGNLLVECLQKLVNLEQLSLYCVTCLDDAFLIRILKSNGAQLTLLNLGGYMALPDKLSDKSIKHVAKHCKNLSSVSFDLFSVSAKLDALQHLFEQKETALKLESINLSVCRSISYDLLTTMALNCRNIKHLDLSGLTQIVDDTLVKIMASVLSQLETLDVKACTKLTDDSIVQVAIKCPIQCLVLSGISSLTDKCIFAIANHLQFSLCDIYLSGCSRISHVALRYLSDCCINRLHFEHRVPGVDPNQLMAKNLDTGDFVRVDLLHF